MDSIERQIKSIEIKSLIASLAKSLGGKEMEDLKDTIKVLCLEFQVDFQTWYNHGLTMRLAKEVEDYLKENKDDKKE